MHECPRCALACDCDGEDTWFDDPPVDCRCECDEDDEIDFDVE